MQKAAEPRKWDFESGTLPYRDQLFKSALRMTRSVEDAEDRYVVSLFIHRKRLDLVPAIRHGRVEPFHESRVALEGRDFGQRTSLGGERRVRRTVVPAGVPAFPGLQGIEELEGIITLGAHYTFSFPVRHGTWAGTDGDRPASLRRGGILRLELRLDEGR